MSGITVVRDVLRLLRPHQWMKNVFCLAGLVFGDRIGEPAAWGKAFLTAGIFCVVSSGTYILNDIFDRERDSLHEKKRTRPIASGKVAVRTGYMLSILLLAAALLCGFLFDASVFLCLLLYLGNNVGYNLFARQIVLGDVFSIALGFCLRLVAGIYVLGDHPTAWILLCTFFLAVFLGSIKRRSELVARPDGHDTRAVLGRYSVPILDRIVSSSSVMTVMCYAFFTILSKKNPSLVVTVPPVYYAIMQYEREASLTKKGEEPEIILLRDYRIHIAIAIWFLTYMGIYYGKFHAFR